MNEQYHDLVIKAYDELKRLHYTQSTMEKYQRCWSRFEKYAMEKNITEFNESYVERFFMETFCYSYIHPPLQLYEKSINTIVH